MLVCYANHVSFIFSCINMYSPLPCEVSEKCEFLGNKETIFLNCFYRANNSLDNPFSKRCISMVVLSLLCLGLKYSFFRHIYFSKMEHIPTKQEVEGQKGEIYIEQDSSRQRKEPKGMVSQDFIVLHIISLVCLKNKALTSFFIIIK